MSHNTSESHIQFKSSGETGNRSHMVALIMIFKSVNGLLNKADPRSSLGSHMHFDITSQVCEKGKKD